MDSFVMDRVTDEDLADLEVDQATPKAGSPKADLQVRRHTLRAHQRPRELPAATALTRVRRAQASMESSGKYEVQPPGAVGNGSVDREAVTRTPPGRARSVSTSALPGVMPCCSALPIVCSRCLPSARRPSVCSTLRPSR